MGASSRHELFAQEYAKDRNATKAAIRSGYSPKTAASQGSRLLKKLNVNRNIVNITHKALESNEIEVNRVLREIARVAFSDVRQIYHQDGSLKLPHEWDDDTAASVAGIDVEHRREPGEDGADITTKKLKRWDKMKALEQCLVYLGIGRQQLPGGGDGHMSLSVTIIGSQVTLNGRG